MARERTDRALSRRRFLGRVGVLALVATGLALADKPSIASADVLRAETAKLASKPTDWEIQQAARNARIQKFITDSEALIRRYGHANY